LILYPFSIELKDKKALKYLNEIIVALPEDTPIHKEVFNILENKMLTHLNTSWLLLFLTYKNDNPLIYEEDVELIEKESDMEFTDIVELVHTVKVGHTYLFDFLSSLFEWEVGNEYKKLKSFSIK